MRRDRTGTVAVIAGGEPVDPAVADRIGDVGYVIAADSGVHVADRLGLAVDLVVGDLDSADPDALERDGITVERHPSAKDQTDIVLALDRAAELGARAVVVVAGIGGRLDHALANLLVLASPDYAGIEIRALVGDADVAVVHRRHALSGPPGTVVSLLAVGGPARGVVTSGLRYPLAGETLEALSSRGVSNELAGGPATVAVDAGTLLVITPGDLRRDSQADESAMEAAT